MLEYMSDISDASRISDALRGWPASFCHAEGGHWFASADGDADGAFCRGRLSNAGAESWQ
jgi:hypothetical protein